jgi:hypothetical protein
LRLGSVSVGLDGDAKAPALSTVMVGNIYFVSALKFAVGHGLITKKGITKKGELRWGQVNTPVLQ